MPSATKALATTPAFGEFGLVVRVLVGDLREILERLQVVVRNAVAVGIHASELPQRQRVRPASRRIRAPAPRPPCRRRCSRARRCAALRAPSRSSTTGAGGRSGAGASSATDALDAERGRARAAKASLDIRIAVLFVRAAGMGHRAVPWRSRRSARISRDSPSRSRSRAASRPCGAARAPSSESFTSMRALDGVDRDDVAVRRSPIGPPTAASGPTWPMQKPRVAPEKRPSVMSATLSPMPWP